MNFVSQKISQGLVWLIEGYQRLISPALPKACRYYPTCSQYVKQALLWHGLWWGLILGGWRLLRCQPFCRGGFDYVPGTIDFHQNIHKTTRRQLVGRKEKTFQVIEQQRTENNVTVFEYFLKHKSLGLVKQTDQYEAVLPDGSKVYAKTQEEALDYLIRHFHLHGI